MLRCLTWIVWTAALAATPVERQGASLELIETAPVETSLDDPELREFAAVWSERLGAARESVELAHFYASDREGGRLSGVIEDLEAAGRRGVRVRFLVDERFCETYPETIARLAAAENIEVRRYDLRALTGGVLHAKYMLVDDEWVCLGSANFDWRSLEHILELGVLAHSAELTAAFLDVFELDWHLAGGGALEEAPAPRAGGQSWPLRMAFGEDDEVLVRPAFSPTGLLPDEALYDLPRLVECIDSARASVSLQLLTYRTVGHDHEYFGDLEAALRRAAARGARVRLLVADWCKRPGTIEGLKSLQLLPGIEVRLVTVPPAAQGHIPFARVIHSKFLVVDGRRSWVGTSNWEASYFHAGRNVGLLVEAESFGRRLDERFERTWFSEYAYRVDPCEGYEVPRIGD